MKLCVIYNFAAHYRSGIFQLIDSTFDTDWFFGKKNDDITKMDLTLLKGDVKEIDRGYWRGIEFQKGVIGLLFKPYGTYLLFAQTKTLSTWIFLLFSKFFRKKKIYLWSHGFYGKESRWERVVKRWMFKLPNGGTFLYGSYARDLMIKEGISPNKLFVIHNSLDYEHQLKIRNSLSSSNIYTDHFGNSNPVVIFIGRLTKIKKLDMLIDMLKAMDDDHQSINLILVGDGIERHSLEHQVKELGLEKNVWFYGACFDELKNAELIYNADVCVAPGNVGLTAMHTMVYGTPVITHNDFPHQMPEFEAIKEGKTGAFFNRDDGNSMASVVKQWLFEKKDCREKVRKDCYAEIDNYWTPSFQIDVIKEHLK